MNADSTFQIGRDHTICEDYTMSGVKDDLAYTIVCDGCSASEHVDIGARALALSARTSILNEGLRKNSAELFGSTAAILARGMFSSLFIKDDGMLDTTLLVAWVTNNVVRAYVFGDGVLIHRKKESIAQYHLNITSGAPDYLSYLLYPDRLKAYNNLKENEKEVWSNIVPPYTIKPFVPFIYESPVEQGDTISIMSDGINSFRKSDNTQIDWRELVDEFTGFKNFEGQFVQRRLSAFKRKFTKENWHHFDDISMASIVV